MFTTDQCVHDNNAGLFRELLAIQLILQLSRNSSRSVLLSGKHAHQVLQQVEFVAFELVHFVCPVGYGHDRSVRQIVNQREHIASNWNEFKRERGRAFVGSGSHLDIYFVRLSLL